MALKKKTAASPSAKKATKKKPIGLGAKFAEEAVKKVASKKKATPAKKAAAKAPAKAAPVKKAAKAAAGSDTVDFSLYPTISYAEEYQVTGFHYAFLSPDNKMCHHWIKCRDFLQDALRNQLTGRNDAIYSFAYRPGKDPEVPTDVTRMLVKRIPTPSTDAAKKEFDEMMQAALNLVNYYEEAHNLGSPSTMMRATHPGTDQYVYLFSGPGIWSQGAIMIAIYTFLIRIGFFRPKFKDEKTLMAEYERIIKDKSASNDTRYLKTVYKNLHPALEHLDKHLFKKPGHKKGDKVLFHDSPMNSFHHHSGIVSLSQGNTPEKGLNETFRKIFSAGK